MKASDLLSTLCTMGDPAIAAHPRRFFKTGPGEHGEGDRFLGLRVPILRYAIEKFPRQNANVISNR